MRLTGFHFRRRSGLVTGRWRGSLFICLSWRRSVLFLWPRKAEPALQELVQKVIQAVSRKK